MVRATGCSYADNTEVQHGRRGRPTRARPFRAGETSLALNELKALQIQSRSVRDDVDHLLDLAFEIARADARKQAVDDRMRLRSLGANS